MESPDLNLDLDDANNSINISCEEVSQDNLREKLNQYSDTSFSMINYNIRSCRKNFQVFLVFLSQLFFNFSLIVLTETWLTKNIDYGFNIPNYEDINLYRNSHGGGIKVYYSNKYTVEVLDNFTYVSDVMEVLAFWLLGNTIKYLIVCIYRPPSASPYVFNDNFNQYLNNLPHNAYTFVLGDLNLNLFNPLKFTYIDSFISNMLSYNYHPIITKASKINLNNTITQFALIDHIWSNFYSGCDHKSFIVHFPLTDHFPTCFVFDNNYSDQRKSFRFRLITQNRIRNFIDYVNNQDFTSIFQIINPNLAFNKFYQNIMNSFNKFFPIKTKKVKKNNIDAPWVNQKLKFCIKKKFRLYNLMRRGLISKQSFKTYKKMLIYVTKKMKQQYYHERFNSFNNDTKKTWNAINNILNRNKPNVISKINVNGSDYMGYQLPNIFNNYFTSIVSSLIADIYPRFTNYHNVINNLNFNVSSCFFTPTIYNEIFDLLKTMGNKGNALHDITHQVDWSQNYSCIGSYI